MQRELTVDAGSTRARARVAHVNFFFYTKHHGREITLYDVKSHTQTI